MQSIIRTANKKGFSNILALAIFIAIVISIAGILFVFFYKSIIGPKLSPAFDCLKMQTNSFISIDKACISSDSGDIKLQIFRGTDNFDLNKAYFVLYSDSKSGKWCCGVGCNECVLPNNLETRNYKMSSLGLGAVKKVVLDVSGCVVDEKEVEEC